ncbi:MAG: dephospho-CoA kinase [Clostridia bacterium]|nr:dephospho-CoA kinase [Clostridia bacterium]
MKKPIWGLTGPTGSGKGAVGALLIARGFEVIDTDALAREAVEPGSPCLAALVNAFSPAILRPDGTLDRAALAERAFADKQAQQTLNAIVHPAVIARTMELLSGDTPVGFVIDAPLLFESGLSRVCDRTVAVLCDAAQRKARIMRRDGLSDDRARLRMNAQPDDAYYIEHADAVIRNDGDLDALEAAVDAVFGGEGGVL